jgi:hypothetical protein
MITDFDLPELSETKSLIEWDVRQLVELWSKVCLPSKTLRQRGHRGAAEFVPKAAKLTRV